MNTITGKVWIFGDNIDTDMLAPGAYMRQPIEVLAAHCLEAIDTKFASTVGKGDILVAGEGFGSGSSREQAAQALLQLGVGAIIAKSFARIFYRNAVNLGLPVIVCHDMSSIKPSDELSIDLEKTLVVNTTSKNQLEVDPIPPLLLNILASGGLIPQLKQRLKNRVGNVK